MLPAGLFLNADTTAISAAVLRVAVVPRVVDAPLAVGALHGGEAATKDLLNADAAAVGAAVVGVTPVPRVVDADVVLVLAIDSGKPSAELVGRLGRRAQGRLGNQGGRGRHTVALAIFTAVAAWVDLLADLAGRAGRNLEAARPLLSGGEAGGPQEGENSEGQVAHGCELATAEGCRYQTE